MRTRTKNARNTLFIIGICVMALLISFPASVYAKKDEAPATTDESSDASSIQTEEELFDYMIDEQTKYLEAQESGEGTARPDSEGLSSPESSAMSSTGPANPIMDSVLAESEPVIGNSDFAGAAVVTIPILVPSGRQGVQPDISLIYNSQRKNGWIGVGWGLDMGSIRRSTKWGVDYSADDYVAEGNGPSGELVDRTTEWGTNYYGGKIEQAFTKYYYNSGNDSWEATTREGIKY